LDLLVELDLNYLELDGSTSGEVAGASGDGDARGGATDDSGGVGEDKRSSGGSRGEPHHDAASSCPFQDAEDFARSFEATVAIQQFNAAVRTGVWMVWVRPGPASFPVCTTALLVICDLTERCLQHAL
jgi:hypothetical protein